MRANRFVDSRTLPSQSASVPAMNNVTVLLINSNIFDALILLKDPTLVFFVLVFTFCSQGFYYLGDWKTLRAWGPSPTDLFYYNPGLKVQGMGGGQLAKVHLTRLWCFHTLPAGTIAVTFNATFIYILG